MVGLYRRFAIANCKDLYRLAARRAIGAAIGALCLLIGILAVSVVGALTLGLIVVAAVVVADAALVLAVGYASLRVRLGNRATLALAAAPAIVFGTMSTVTNSRPAPLTDVSLRFVLLLVAVSYTVTVAAFVVMGLHFMRGPMLAKYSPGVAASGELVSVVSALADDHPFLYFPTRNAIMKRLGSSADLLELYLPRAVRVPDAVGSAVFQDRCSGAARYLRDLRLWVALPMPDTAERLRIELVRLVHSLVQGTYDDLPASTARSRRGRISVLAVSIRELASGLFPIGTILGARAVGLPLEGVTGNALVAFGVMWAVVSLVIAFDPKVAERLATLREMVAATRTGSGDQESL